MAQQARDTFVAEIDGASFSVVKGQVFHDQHPLVRLDAGRGILFAPLEGTEPPPEAVKSARPGRAPAGKDAG